MPENYAKKNSRNENAESTGHEYDRPGVLRRLGQKAMDYWHDEDRPGIFELHFYYLPMAVVIAGTGVAVSDDVLHTHFADDMASVSVVKDSNVVERTLEEFVQEIGHAAGGHAHK